MILPKKTPISLLAKVVTFFRVIKKILTDILRPKNTLAMFLNGFQPKKRKKPLNRFSKKYIKFYRHILNSKFLVNESIFVTFANFKVFFQDFSGISKNGHL